jgi:hypothetical protein
MDFLQRSPFLDLLYEKKRNEPIVDEQRTRVRDARALPLSSRVNLSMSTFMC